MAGFRTTLGALRLDMARSDPEVGGISSTAAERAARVSQRTVNKKPKSQLPCRMGCRCGRTATAVLLPELHNNYPSIFFLFSIKSFSYLLCLRWIQLLLLFPNILSDALGFFPPTGLGVLLLFTVRTF